MQSARHAIAVTVLALAACGGASKSASRAAMAPDTAAASEAAAPAAPAAPGAPQDATAAMGPQTAAAGGGGGTKPLQQTAKPLLIYTANITLAVFEAAKGIDAVEDLARATGGYLVSRTNNAITIRVPSEAFHGAVSEITQLGDPLRRDVNVQDVTDQFRDLEVRLKNLHAVRDRLEGLLAKAKNVQEALAVERELERVTAQIEQMKGKLKMLSHLVAYSTINVSFQARPVERIDPIVKLPFNWLEQLGLQRLLQL